MANRKKPKRTPKGTSKPTDPTDVVDQMRAEMDAIEVPTLDDLNTPEFLAWSGASVRPTVWSN